jgi:glycosyltransferase involved in cell wall biosynthesis
MEMSTVSLLPPSVTLVIANFNHAQYLPESLGSIIAQTRAPDRVLIIDDASTDDSLNVIARFVNDNPSWKLIRHDQNVGVVPRQNEAIRLIDTDWIGFLGADDALHPTYLEKALAHAARFPQAGLICACTEIIGISQARALRPVILPERQATFVTPDYLLKLLRVGDNYHSGTVTLYRRTALTALGGFDEELGSFADGLRARELALRFGFFFVPEILGYWRIHELNYSTSMLTDPAILSAKLGQIRALIAGNEAFPRNYADLFERRLRFGASRVVISGNLATSTKADRVSALLNFRQADKRRLKLVLSFGRFGTIAALAWATLRTRPLSLVRLVTQIPTRRAIVAARTPYRPP